MAAPASTAATATIEDLTLRYGSVPHHRKQQNQPNPPHSMLMRDDVVKIDIGPDRMECFVHPRLLLEHPEYFKRALTGSWKEAAARNRAG
ncbi:hypothetical protein ST47_g3801 [Ascochyta rabiei]|uniref:BTB domain-containing protein n=1 Tax=Didymella rabiei TaxID=5454 RepID=A0A163GXJ9_DIDRA|nr:hypothetical protein ST47_g3801 [Ascochyta rabiei]